MLQVDIIVDEQEIKDGILKEIQSYLMSKFQQAAKNALLPVQNIIRDEIVNSHEYQHLLPGSRTYHEFGIPDIEKRLAKIVDVIVDGIEVDYILPYIASHQINGKYSVKVLKRDFSDILSLSEAKFTYTSKKYPAGHTLNWLEWLLLAGSSSIILDYHFAPVKKPQSRTGMGLMFKGGSWGVQPFSAGTLRDNFLIRAANRCAYEVIKAVEKEFLILDS